MHDVSPVSHSSSAQPMSLKKRRGSQSSACLKLFCLQSPKGQIALLRYADLHALILRPHSRSYGASGCCSFDSQVAQCSNGPASWALRWSDGKWQEGRHCPEGGCLPKDAVAQAIGMRHDTNHMTCRPWISFAWTRITRITRNVFFEFFLNHSESLEMVLDGLPVLKGPACWWQSVARAPSRSRELNGAEMDSDDLTAESSRYKFGASPRGHGDISRVVLQYWGTLRILRCFLFLGH